MGLAVSGGRLVTVLADDFGDVMVLALPLS
jgi:hypothetical protein